MSKNSAVTKYIGAFVDELANSGVRRVIVSPGSRSTPIAMMLAEHPQIEVMIHVDERSAGFFGLGIAKATNQPVGLVCTSGTAAANYFPAIVEAYYARVPLVVITADRPHELRDIHAPQTMNQVNMYGNHVKWFQDMPLPEETTGMLKFVRTVSARAVQTAMQVPAGPVHLNFPLREPLVPDLNDPEKFESNITVVPQVNSSRLLLEKEAFMDIANSLPEKGLIVCGPVDSIDPYFNEAITKLAATLNYPILADPLSQLRSGKHDKKLVIDSYNAILKDEQVRMALQPEMILRFGAMPVSKSLMFYLKEHANVPQYIIDSGQGWRDPTSTASEIIYCDERLFCEELTQLVRNKEAFQSPNWISKWVKLNQLVHTVINKHDLEELTEMKVFYDLQKLIPTDAWLFVGNSMPIRDLDAFYHCHDGLQTVIGNRGVNGIDGLVSTALGVSVEKKHSYLLIGDLSFYHDLNGLLAAKLHQLNLTIIVINNNGGAIFSMLPQADHPKHFELLFGTPTDLQFENVTKMYGGKHFLVESLQQFVDAIKKANELAGLKVIEVMTNRVENAEYRRKLWEDVSQEIIRWLEHEAKGESNGTNN